MKLFKSLIIILSALHCPQLVAKNNSDVLELNDFIARATQHDVKFESILIDRLPLQYRRAALLPDSDILMELKYQHYFYPDQDRDDPAASVSLSKLFPYQGTRVSVDYNRASSPFPNQSDSSLQLLISQPIAKNAFGRGVELQDKIIGIENQLSRYQIIEAYEDYLASLTTAYYNWYSAYEDLKTGQASYRSNQKLMDNILERQRENIALPIDVNKMKLLLTSKQENLVILEDTYQNYSNLVFKAIGHNEKTRLIPANPGKSATRVVFKRDYQQFTETSRTYNMLRLLEKQGTLTVKKAADDLMPSTNLLLGYKLEGQDWGIKDEENSYFAGIELRMPIGNSVNKARKKIEEIKYRKTVLSNQDKYQELHTNLKNLYQQIEREQELINISRTKLRLSKDILRDETENYSYGKVTLNDYIDAVNQVDINRFNLTQHSVQLNKLVVEWLRLTDRLVGRNVLDTQAQQPGK